MREKGYGIERVIERVSNLFSMSRQDIPNPSRQRQGGRARSVLCYWAIRELGMSGSELSHILWMNRSSVSRAAGRGGKQINDRKLRLIEK
jgi:putative transposase